MLALLNGDREERAEFGGACWVYDGMMKRWSGGSGLVLVLRMREYVSVRCYSHVFSRLQSRGRASFL